MRVRTLGSYGLRSAGFQVGIRAEGDGFEARGLRLHFAQSVLISPVWVQVFLHRTPYPGASYLLVRLQMRNDLHKMPTDVCARPFLRTRMSRCAQGGAYGHNQVRSISFPLRLVNIGFACQKNVMRAKNEASLRKNLAGQSRPFAPELSVSRDRIAHLRIPYQGWLAGTLIFDSISKNSRSNVHLNTLNKPLKSSTEVLSRRWTCI